MGVLFHGGRGLDRVYYGTDTRAGGLLVGASLALGWLVSRGRPTRADPRRCPVAGRPSLSAARALARAGDDGSLPTATRRGSIRSGWSASTSRCSSSSRSWSLRPRRVAGPLSPATLLDRDDLVRALPLALPAVPVARYHVHRRQRDHAAAAARHRHGDRQRPLVPVDRAAGPPRSAPHLAGPVARDAGRRWRRVTLLLGSAFGSVSSDMQSDSAPPGPGQARGQRSGVHGRADGHRATASLRWRPAGDRL